MLRPAPATARFDAREDPKFEQLRPSGRRTAALAPYPTDRPDRPNRRSSRVPSLTAADRDASDVVVVLKDVLTSQRRDSPAKRWFPARAVLGRGPGAGCAERLDDGPRSDEPNSSDTTVPLPSPIAGVVREARVDLQ